MDAKTEGCAVMSELTWTRFADRSALHAREQAQEWRDLLGHIQSAGPYASKAACPWIKLARFGTSRSRGNSLRNNRNVLEVTGVEGDYDGEQMAPEDALTLLERAGVRAAVYTSPSHTASRPRWRVLAPLSRPLPASERTHMLARINGALGGVLTPESFTLSQSYYYGRVNGQADYRVLVTYDDPDDGHCVDNLDELDAIAVGPARTVPDDDSGPGASHAIAAAVEQLGRRLRTGDNRRNLLRAYIGDKSVRGLSADELGVLVKDLVGRFFDPDDTPDWSDIAGIIDAFTAEDASRRQSVQDTVGEFVAGLATGVDHPQKQDGLQFLSLAALRQAAGSVSWLVKHAIPADSIGIVFGGSGTFKSFIALDMALHVAHGLRWMGKKTRRGPVVFIAAEGGSGLWRRVEAWHKARNLSWDGIEFYVVPVAVDLGRHANRVVEAAQSVGVTPSLVVVDTLSQTFSGEENSANEIAGYLGALGSGFRAVWRCAVLVIHHSGHSATERPRGSSAIRGNVDFMLGVWRDEKEMLATVSCVKQKDGDEFGDQTFALTSHVLGNDDDGDAVTSLEARHIDDKVELAEVMLQEAKAGRGGRNSLLIGLARDGMDERDLRRDFYAEIGEAEQDAKKKAFQRAMKWASENGKFAVENGVVKVVK